MAPTLQVGHLILGHGVEPDVLPEGLAPPRIAVAASAAPGELFHLTAPDPGVPGRHLLQEDAALVAVVVPGEGDSGDEVGGAPVHHDAVLVAAVSKVANMIGVVPVKY